MGENDAKTECSKSSAEAQAETDKNKPAEEEVVAAASSTSAEEQGSASATGDEGSVDIDVDALSLLAQGKRNLVIGDAVQAVQSFQEASALLAAKYGETAKECGEAYFKYGCALLELARMETGVLGNALDGVPDEASDSEDEGTTEKPAGSSVVESTKDIQGPEREQIFKDVYSALDENSEERKKEKAKKENGGEESENTDDVEMESTENGKEDDIKVNGEKKEESKTDENKVEATKEEEQEKEEEMETDKDSNKGETKDTDKKDKDTKVADTKDMETAESDSKDTEAKKDGEPVSKESENETKDITKKKDGESDAKEKEEDEGAGCSKEESENDQAGTTDGEAKTEDDEGENADDVPNFQLSWEMLELARVIFSKEDDKESQLKVAQVHLTLGELGMETEQYAQSIEDFLKCLAIQVKHVEDDSRLLAETHYNLGLVYCLDKQFDKSIESYGKSKDVIEQRIVNLRKHVEENETGKGKEKENTDNPLAATRKEIKELEELVPDITAKIEDSKEMMKTADDPAKKAIVAAAAEFGIGPGASSSAFAQSSTSSAPAKTIAIKSAQKTEDSAKDITHLVRKKRKTEGDGDANETKKSRNDEPATNGNGDASSEHGKGDTPNGHTNGDGSSGEKAQEEIKPKTVEDVKAAKECSMETA